jgi:glycosyltransferase involved in cell wall biosynthesis
VSQKTADDLRILSPSAQIDVSVIHHALSDGYVPVAREAVSSLLVGKGLFADTEYLLHVGNNSWYKNRPGAMRIFAALKKAPRFERTKLILAGKRWTAEMTALAKELGLAGEIYEMTDLTDDDLRSLYTGAMALLFPSREEGFGWPILEAQACGCPVITTNRAPMTEIAGDAAIFIQPEQPEIAAVTILNTVDHLPALREAGFVNAAQFTTDRMIDAYYNAYRRIASER